MPLLLLVFMVEVNAHLTNFFPLKAGISDTYSPLTIVEKIQVDADVHFKFAFGDYVLAPKTTTNAPAPHMVDCIYIGPMFNRQGGHRFYNLHTRKVITRHWAVSAPMSKAIIDMVNDMGTADGMTHIKFMTPNKKVMWDSSLLAGVDHIPF